MSIIRTTAAGLVLGFALTGAAAAPSFAVKGGHSDQQPCAQQQAQYDRATAKLAVLTERYQDHPTAENRKAKKAQQQRVAHSQARLQKCQAAHPA